MKNEIIITAIFLSMALFATTLSGQVIMGVDAGVQVNDTRVKGAGNFLGGLPKSIVSPYGRITVTLPIAEQFSFRTGLGYSQKGFKISEGFDVDIFNLPIDIGVKVATKADYIDLPLEGVLTLPGNKTKLQLIGGTQLGYATGGRIQPKASLIFDINLSEIPINLSQGIYNRWDISSVAGLGLSQAAGRGQFLFQARYLHSFTNFLDNPIVDVKIKPTAFQFSIGYQMPIGKV